MIEHLFSNCHGEANWIMFIITSIPFVGALFSSFIRRPKGCCGEDDNHKHP